jgi:Undecaprenyl-phosphate glucose phosphotransferase
VIVSQSQIVSNRDAEVTGPGSLVPAIRGTEPQIQGVPEPGRALSLMSPAVICGLMRAFEAVLVAATGLNIYFLYVAPFETQMVGAYWAACLGTAAATVALLEALGLYDPGPLRRHLRASARVLAAWSTVFAGLVVLAFVTQVGEDFSRGWLILWYGVGATGLVAGRATASALIGALAASGHMDRRAVLVGGGERAGELIATMGASADAGIRICGIFDDRGDARSPAVVAGCPKLGTVDQLVDFVRRTRIDLLIVTLPLAAERRLLDILKQVWVLPIDIRLSAQSSRLRFRPRAYSHIGGVPFLDLFDRPISDWGAILKAVEDRAIAALALIALAPVMGLIALAIRLDSAGPVLFRQSRYGFNNEMIGVLKFRSLRADMTDADAARLVTRHDPRVTRVGRFIRRTSLDELPQLFNVLKGELSLVGPRPHALQAKAADRLYGDVVDGYFARHKVKPGITGWAQINGWRGQTETEAQIQRRVEHDLFYIEHWSVIFDLYILAMTPFALFDGDRAY